MKRRFAKNGPILLLIAGLMLLTAFGAAAAESVLTFPADLTAVEEEAFAGDSDIVTVSLPDGCASIGSRAFADCAGLNAVYLPRNISAIAEDAFENSPGAVLWCYSDTYAYQYAIRKNLPFRFREAVTAYKVAILTGTSAQGSEEYDAAQALVTSYPNNALHDTYPDDFYENTQTTVNKLLAFATDPAVKAIVAVQAVDGTAAAFQQIKVSRPDILLVAGVPAEEPSAIAAAADIVLASNDLAAGAQVAGLAAQWDCDVLVHYSFPRHMGLQTILDKHNLMKSTAESAGVTFVDRTCQDPASVGMADAFSFILSDLSDVMADYPNQKVCFYCTNCGLQAALQQAVAANGNAYYGLPCCPSPFHGFQDAFGLTASYGDAPGALTQLANYLSAHNALRRFSTWAAPVNRAMIEGAFAYGSAWARGELTGRLDTAALQSCVTTAAGETVAYSQYGGYANYQLLALEPVDFVNYVTMAGNEKVAILTGTSAQGSEEYDTAQALAAANPGKVLHDTYPDDFYENTQVTANKLLAFATDPTVKTIVAVQAVDGTAAAFQQIKVSRPDILLIAGTPAEAPETIAAAADIVLAVDDLEAGRQVANLAIQWDCDVLVHYSFPRHMGFQTILDKHDLMKSTVEAAGITFVDRTCLDPSLKEVGMENALAFIASDLPAVMAAYPNQKVCFYCTNCGLQMALQSAVLADENAYYALPCCPSPFHGFQDAFELTASYDDISGALSGLANFLSERDALGRFSTWASPINAALINCGFAYGTDWATGQLASKLNTQKLIDRLTEAVKTEAGFNQYGTYANYQLVSLNPIDFADYVTIP